MFEALFANNGLSLDRLRVLCEVAEAGGIARAVPDDHSKQSQFSRQLKQLEDFFEVELTCRVGKGIGLTPAGQALAQRTREMLQSLDDFRLEWKNRPVTFSIGAGESLLEWLVLPKIAEAGVTPLASFNLRNLRTKDIVTGLQELSLDFGILRSDAIASPLASRLLGKIHHALFCPQSIVKQWPGAKLDEMLQNAPLALLDSDGDFMNAFKAWADQKGIPLSVKLACDSYPKAFRAVKSGKFAAILPSIAEWELPKGEFVKFSLPIKKQAREVCLAWNPRTLRLRSQAEKVADFLEEILRI